jgi:hypothetical protein
LWLITTIETRIVDVGQNNQLCYVNIASLKGEERRGEGNGYPFLMFGYFKN